MGPKRWLSGLLTGIACGGLAVGHVLTYVISVPRAAARQELLAHTGHGYAQAGWVVVGVIAVLSIAVMLGVGVARGIGVGSARPGLRWAVTRASTIQVLAFVGLECIERVVAGTSVEALIGVHLIVGIVVQLVIGAAVGFLLVAIDRAGQIVGSLVSDQPDRAASESGPKLISLDLLAESLRFETPRTTRGPPVTDLF